jgi:2-amino-4-hydroxy-6-hydroxymethyldihydropteridine diphosphokinase
LGKQSAKGCRVKVYLGFGSNLGEREQNIKAALRAIDEEKDICLHKVSSVHETEPEYVREQPKFMNCVAEGETSLSPGRLLGCLKRIEKRLGRTGGERWGPRIIDIDILLYNDFIVDEPGLRIPHPRLRERVFVLLPLTEIAPGLRDPVSGQTVGELLRQLRR